MMIGTTANTSRFILVALLAGSLLGCGDPPTEPEEAVRAWVATGHSLAEDKKRRDLMDMVSPAYSDARGNERADIENLFRFYFLRANGIALLPKINEVRIFGDSAAEIDLTVGMAATNDGVLGFSADAYHFELELVRDGDEWLLISGRWGEVGEELH
ncbi:MAG: hypothetical protein ACR2QT_11675 [Woeseiaceae bacterium]